MGSLVKHIEMYLKQMLIENQGIIEIQRNELAQFFNCVPSQINYVLKTRFGLNQGFLVESRRGGRGYIRIVKISLKDETTRCMFRSLLKGGISQQAAEGLLDRLYEDGFLTWREKIIIRNMIKRDNLPLELPERDFIRAKLLEAVLLIVGREDFNKQ